MLRPRIIYLDQCVLSRFRGRSGNSSWREVYDQLLRGVETGRIVCPHSLEHAVETSGMAYDDAIEVDSILRQLSAGWSLRTEPELVATQLNQYIRGTEPNPDYAFERTRLRPLSDVRFYELLRQTKESLDARNNQEFELQNALSRDNPRGDRTILEVLGRLENETYQRQFVADLQPSLQDGRPHVVTRPGMPHYPREFSFITALLIESHGFGVPELQAVAAQVRKQGVIFIPFYLAKVTLEACLRWKRVQRDHGDQYDVTRLSCALPVADVIVTDGSAASAIRDVGLDEVFGVQVFSTGDAERAGLVETLKASLA